MSRTVRTIVTYAAVRLSYASSAFALGFGQPSMACYGQVVDGNDETIFNPRGLFYSTPQGRLRH